MILPREWKLVVLVHREDLINAPRARLISIPGAKKSWLHRLYWEWIGFNRLSHKLRPSLWLSLQDITSRVTATRQAVYCQNPSPFYRVSMREALQEPKFLLFNWFYSYLYRALAHRNYCVVVQQEWIRREFRRHTGQVPVIVAHPVSEPRTSPASSAKSPPSRHIFLYPALPRVFKNIETLCEAAKLLVERGASDFEVRLTMDGGENRYARWLHSRFRTIRQIVFLGRQDKDQMNRQYREATSVVFPSKLETWGLPISEAKARNLRLLVADLPYARETVGTYERVDFFSASSASSLAMLMQGVIEGNLRPAGHQGTVPAAPFAEDWNALWRLLVADLVPPAHQSPTS
jgi:glycosyltransferase involved in cell wall biosynthesis